MFQTLKKLKQNFFFRFSRKAKTQAIFNQLSRREFDGGSFVHSIICLSMKPSEEDLRQSFESLKVEVNNFFDILSTHFSGLHEISQEDSIYHSQVLAAKAMVTFCEDLYLVSSVVLLTKNNDGTWQTIEGKPSSFFDEPKPAIIFQEYPRSIEISFCGGFGDVNHLEQKNFKYSQDFFFAI